MFSVNTIKNMLEKMMTKSSNRRSSSSNNSKSNRNRSWLRRRRDPSILNIIMQRTTFTILLVYLCQVSSANASEEVTTKLSPVYIPLTEVPVIDSQTDRQTTGHNQKYSNSSIDTGNTLVDGIVNQCSTDPSISCIQKNVYSYLDDTLGFSGDVNVTDTFKFMKNNLPYWKYTKKANEKSENDVDSDEGLFEHDEEDEESPRFSESPIEEVTDALYGKGVSFLMSHDMELKLPEMMFHGAVLKVSPRGMEGDGALVRLDLIPQEVNSNGEGRILFKKLKKWIKNKILLAILAIIIIVKLIKLKLFIFLPLIIGVHNAKKLFLKLVLFVFPALSNIFKLCSWYHSNYHGNKQHHHHHHQISHLHHSIPHLPPGGPIYGAPVHGAVEVHGPYGPSPHHQGPIYQHEPDTWISSGPGLGPEYLSGDIHRNAVSGPGAFSPKPEDSQDINAWGLGSFPGASTATTSTYLRPSPYFEEQKFMRQAAEAAAAASNRNKVTVAAPQGPPLTSYSSIRKPNVVLQAEKEALIRAAAQKQEQYRLQLKAQELLKLKSTQKTTLLNAITSQEPAAPVYDSFYSPLLQRVDQVFSLLAFNDESCRERLVCSMYKNPQKFSPHSNIISNEISREASELPKPTAGSTIALRFFRYVQAARDGQEKKDCLTIYSNCSIDTDK